jgi:murein DD-endopeptidase MepM/ murein hydrolase activator NlpD
LAEIENDLDVLATLISTLQKAKSPEYLGLRNEDWRIALWEYYQNPRAVERIQQFAHIYATHQTLDLGKTRFPLNVKAHYTYNSTWGAKRGWGGKRIHEGTDLFAPSGTAIYSVCYGIVEQMGWNPYGGWRIGIRDLQNRYHYFAHLSGFDKKIRIGDVVNPSIRIGWVGSSGYGKPGTTGKFPPHLHYGIYRDHGYEDWSFDPYPMLRKWEREMKKKHHAFDIN